MAGSLITLEKGKQTALCERFQLDAMLAKGWRVAPPPKVDAHGNPIEVEIKPDMFEVAKGEKTGWCDEKTWPALEKQGWQRGPAQAGTEEAPDEVQRAGGERLAEVLGSLDPEDDDLWTLAGTLRIETFNETFDLNETRASVGQAWPDFSRDALRAWQAEE